MRVESYAGCLERVILGVAGRDYSGSWIWTSENARSTRLGEYHAAQFPSARSRSQPMAAAAPELRVEVCPSSGYSHSCAEGQRCASPSPCEAGSTRSRPPCTKRTGAATSAGSKPHRRHPRDRPR
jgi:hypothetical protein